MKTDELIGNVRSLVARAKGNASQDVNTLDSVSARLRAADALYEAVWKDSVMGFDEIREAAEAYRKASEGGGK